MSSKTLLDKVRQIQQEKNEKIIPENLPNNVTVYGVSGGVVDVRNSSLDISQEGAQLVKHIESSTGEDWYAAEVTGLSAYDGGNGVIVGANNLIQLPLDAPDIANVIGLTANKIKKDETILGITGTYEGSSTSNRYLLYSEDREDYDEETGELLSHYLAYWIGCNNVQITSEYNADISPDGSTDVVNCINSTSDVALLGACNVDSEQQCWYISSILGVNNTDNYYTVYTCDEDGEHKHPTYAIIPPHSMYVPGSIYNISTGQQVPLSKLPALYIEVLDV